MYCISSRKTHFLIFSISIIDFLLEDLHFVFKNVILLWFLYEKKKTRYISLRKENSNKKWEKFNFCWIWWLKRFCVRRFAVKSLRWNPGLSVILRPFQQRPIAKNRNRMQNRNCLLSDIDARRSLKSSDRNIFHGLNKKFTPYWINWINIAKYLFDENYNIFYYVLSENIHLIQHLWYKRQSATFCLCLRDSRLLRLFIKIFQQFLKFINEIQLA